MSTSFFAQLQETIDPVIENLTAKGVERRHLTFGGEGIPPTRKPTIPTDARSEFLAHRAMGDWAEQMLAAALSNAFPKLNVIQYGDTERLAAGDPTFKDFYVAGLEATRRFGKRPDLLLFPTETKLSADWSRHGDPEVDDIVKRALAAIEVRSSKMEAERYMAVRKRQREQGSRGSREAPSFTVKVEDLVIVYRWLERYGVPQAYCQVFFDSVFGINFLDIFSTVAGGSGYLIETPARSQEKSTIMIPITSGTKIGKATALPTFTAKHRVTELGRHDAYVVPVGGGFVIDADKARGVLRL